LAFRVLFVCSGNTCRSPMAEALLKDRILRDPDLRSLGVEVGSAGLDAREGEPAAEGAVRALKSRGIGLEEHQTRRFGVDHLEYDLILTMTESHKSRILLAYPEAAAKVYTLKEYARLDGPSDIADPFMQGDEAYRSALEEIGRAVEALAGRLKEQLAGAEEAKRGESES